MAADAPATPPAAGHTPTKEPPPSHLDDCGLALWRDATSVVDGREEVSTGLSFIAVSIREQLRAESRYNRLLASNAALVAACEAARTALGGDEEGADPFRGERERAALAEIDAALAALSAACCLWARRAAPLTPAPPTGGPPA